MSAKRKPVRSRIVGEGEVAPAELAANPNNWRVHPDAQREAMTGVLDEVGWVQRVVVNRRSGFVVDGHLRVAIALERGEAKVPVEYVDLTDREERIILAAFDPLASMATRDQGALESLLDGLNVRSGALQELLDGLGTAPPEEVAKTDAEVIPPPPKRPRTKPGDVWTLGRHRLLCADCFEPDGMDRLFAGEAADVVLTDPPYAIYGSSTGVGSDVSDDKMVRPFFEALGRMAITRVKLYGHVYVHCDWRSFAAVWEGMKRAGLSPRNCLVWDKGDFGMGSNWANAHEFLAFFARLPEKRMTLRKTERSGVQRQVMRTNILRFPRPRGEERQHNAAKPLDLLAEVLEHSSDEGDTVLDPFAGSGSTLIAAELGGRRCLAVEIEPSWCDVIVARYERRTGERAERPDV